MTSYTSLLMILSFGLDSVAPRFLLQKQFVGSTGPVVLDSSGKRVNYSVIVLHRNKKGFEKVQAQCILEIF